MQLTNGSHILGWGYEGHTIDELLDDARQWGVSTVVDVRLNPISRKPGFSKRKLSERLSDGGVHYLHLPALGNPKDNRAGFSDPTGLEGRLARRRFADDVLESNEAIAALAQVLDLAKAGSVLLLCYEASERCCHRSLVLDALRVSAALQLV